jgi:hypothetical protein
VSELDELVARYVAAWNEPDSDKRRALVVDFGMKPRSVTTMQANRMDATRSPTP